MEKKGIIFDLDGTILDSMHIWEEIDKKFLGKRGLEVPEDYLRSIAPLGFERAAVYTIERFGFLETPEQIIAEWYQMATDAYANQVQLKPSAEEYLRYLKNGGSRLELQHPVNRRCFCRHWSEMEFWICLSPTQLCEKYRGEKSFRIFMRDRLKRWDFAGRMCSI